MDNSQKSKSRASALVCSNCGKKYSMKEINTFAACCNQPLIVEYDFGEKLSKENSASRTNDMWRYKEMLPVFDENNIVSLGEGMTPILSLEHLASEYGMRHLTMKDESLNPTDSFKARGMSMAVSKAKELEIQKCIIPTAGNAGVALAAYCAKAAIACCIVMPKHTPNAFKKVCQLYGAETILVDGLISDCAKKVNELNEKNGYFDMSTLKEPYRIEGKKTIGYEIAEQMNWDLPEHIIIPTGGGTALIGIWKAFSEMQKLGWIGNRLPKMIAVQSQHCNPISRSMHDPTHWTNHFLPLPSVANGITVPYPFGIKMIHEVIKESGGTVFDVSEEDIVAGVYEIAEKEGIFVAPEGAAAWKALQRLHKLGVIPSESKTLILNTGSGDKYLENLT